MPLSRNGGAKVQLSFDIQRVVFFISAYLNDIYFIYMIPCAIMA